MMIVSCLVWYSMLLLFAQTQHPAAGIAVLALAGCAQSLSQIPMAALLLRNSDAQFRGRIMGLRMLAIYGMPVGLLISGPLIRSFGYPVPSSPSVGFGLSSPVLTAARWRSHLWRLGAPANPL